MSTVIKAGQRSSPSSDDARRVAFNFEDMGDRAHRYLEQIRGEAEKILQQARRQAAEIQRRAEEEGRQTAMQAMEKTAEEKVGQQVRTLLPAIKQAAGEIEQAKAAWMSYWESNAVHLAVAIAKRIIRREVENEPEIQLEWIREALRLATGSAEMTLRLHPEDRATLGNHAQQIAQAVSGAGQVNIVADESIAAGGCRVDTKFGSIDQQIEAQLSRIEEELT